MFNFLKNYLFEPRIAFMIFICFIIGYLVFLDEEGAFKDFTKFGPDPSIKFLGMKVDTWKKSNSHIHCRFLFSIITRILWNSYVRLYTFKIMESSL